MKEICLTEKKFHLQFFLSRVDGGQKEKLKHLKKVEDDQKFKSEKKKLNKEELSKERNFLISERKETNL